MGSWTCRPGVLESKLCWRLLQDEASDQNLGVRFKGRILRILCGSQGERLEGRGEGVNTPEVTSRKE